MCIWPDWLLRAGWAGLGPHTWTPLAGEVCGCSSSTEHRGQRPEGGLLLLSHKPWTEEWVMTSGRPLLTSTHTVSQSGPTCPGTLDFWSHVESMRIFKECFSVCLIFPAVFVNKDLGGLVITI